MSNVLRGQWVPLSATKANMLVEFGMIMILPDFTDTYKLTVEMFPVEASPNWRYVYWTGLVTSNCNRSCQGCESSAHLASWPIQPSMLAKVELTKEFPVTFFYAINH